jgi:4'-phosphopantetheinyl transferase
VENARGDDDAKEDVFRRHWSLKEALVKAMGVGLAMELNRADFACEGEDGSDS